MSSIIVGSPTNVERHTRPYAPLYSRGLKMALNIDRMMFTSIIQDSSLEKVMNAWRRNRTVLRFLPALEKAENISGIIVSLSRPSER